MLTGFPIAGTANKLNTATQANVRAEVIFWSERQRARKPSGFTSGMKSPFVNTPTPPKPKRNCPRKIRQPIGGWPRLSVNESNDGDYTFETINFP
jgi:hypothetical protein